MALTIHSEAPGWTALAVAKKLNSITDNQEETKTMKAQIQENLITDSTNAAQLQAGRILYTSAVKLLAPVLPKFAWYKKLFVSSSKRETAVLLAVLGLLHLVRGKYDHYAFEAITLYINYELQSHVVDLGGMELQKMLKLPTKVD